MSHNLDNLGGAHRSHRPTPPSFKINPENIDPRWIDHRIDPQELANRVQSAANSITPPAKSKASEVISTKKSPPLPPKGVNPEVKHILDKMQNTAKEGLTAKQGVMGQEISQVQANIKDNRQNIKWFRGNKKWAQDEIKRLKESQKLLDFINLTNGHYDGVNKVIQDTVQEYFNLLNDLEINTPSERKISSLSNGQDVNENNSLISSINNLVDSQFTTKAPTVLENLPITESTPTKSLTNEQIIKSLAGNRELRPEGFAFLERVSSGNLKKNFEDHLRTTFIITDLEKKKNPQDFVNQWVADLQTMRDRQLSRLENGQNALSTFDADYRSLGNRSDAFNEFIQLIFSDDLITKQEKELFETFFRDVTECAILISSQLISDDFIPPGLREKIKLTPTQTRAEDVARANQEKGITEGFTQRRLSNMQHKSNWKTLEFDKGIFHQGYFEVAIRSPNGEPATYGALFDLSLLHDLTGGLNEEQVLEIFKMVLFILPRQFYLLNKTPEELQLLLEKGEIQNYDITGVKELNDMLNDKEKLGLKDEQLAVLRTIIIDFCNKITNATNLALLTVGHEKE